MGNTPRTDALCREISSLPHCCRRLRRKRYLAIAREFERENTALRAAVETALADCESEIASQEESQLRVPSEFLKGRVRMYRRALAGVATISRGDGSVQPESRQAETTAGTRSGDSISK